MSTKIAFIFVLWGMTRSLSSKKYGVLTPDLRQMCNDMVERGVTEAAMESTAVYWVPVWNELCESMELKLVNPYFIKAAAWTQE